MLSKKTLTEKVHTLKDLEREYKELELRMDSIKDELKAEMAKRNVTELSGDDWKVTLATITANKFNQAEFKEAHPKLYESFKRVTEYYKMTVR